MGIHISISAGMGYARDKIVRRVQIDRPPRITHDHILSHMQDTRGQKRQNHVQVLMRQKEVRLDTKSHATGVRHHICHRPWCPASQRALGRGLLTEFLAAAVPLHDLLQRQRILVVVWCLHPALNDHGDVLLDRRELLLREAE